MKWKMLSVLDMDFVAQDVFRAHFMRWYDSPISYPMSLSLFLWAQVHVYLIRTREENEVKGLLR